MHGSTRTTVLHVIRPFDRHGDLTLTSFPLKSWGMTSKGITIPNHEVVALYHNACPAPVFLCHAVLLRASATRILMPYLPVQQTKQSSPAFDSKEVKHRPSVRAKAFPETVHLEIEVTRTSCCQSQDQTPEKLLYSLLQATRGKK